MWLPVGTSVKRACFNRPTVLTPTTTIGNISIWFETIPASSWDNFSGTCIRIAFGLCMTKLVRHLYHLSHSFFFMAYRYSFIFVKGSRCICFLGRPISWAMIAPSITPKRNHMGPNNPGLRLYKFNKDTGQVSVSIISSVIVIVNNNIYFFLNMFLH